MSECFSAGFSSWDNKLNAPTIGKIKKTAKEFEKSEAQSRKRALLLLIAAYLGECNLHGTVDTLANEAQLTLASCELCDNVDLDIILQDYQTYYQTKFGRPVRLVRNKKNGGDVTSGAGGFVAGGDGGSTKGVVKRKSASGIHSANHLARKNSGHDTSSEVLIETPQDRSLLEISVTSLSKSDKLNPDPQFLSPQTHPCQISTDEVSSAQTDSYFNTCPLQRPLHEFERYTPEWRDLADQVMKEVIHPGLVDGRRVAKVTWADCIGVEECVQVLKEAVVYPVRYPEWFQSGGATTYGTIVSPWRGLLLYGPPGTGKTLLAKAVASEATTTFINLTSSTFVSKWRGDSEKLLKVLFDIARFYAPTTIFIDELDSLAGKHEDTQHEASKRFTSELLIQLDGLLYDDDKIFILATTNNPWHIHNAMLRRFEKRLHVPLPSIPVRQLLFQHYLQPLLSTTNNRTANISPDDYHQMALWTTHYSGADIRLACKEVAMQLVREKIGTMEAGGGIGKTPPGGKIREILLEDVRRAIGVVRRTCTDKEEKKYEEWMQKYQ